MKRSVAEERELWNSQMSGIPMFPISKNLQFVQTIKLVEIIGNDEVNLDDIPDIDNFKSPQSWREILRVLHPIGLAEKSKDKVFLTEDGKLFLQNKSVDFLASLIASRIKLFAETLDLVCDSKLTIKEIYDQLSKKYPVDLGKTVDNVRKRVNWLEVLGLLERVSTDKITATELGKKLVKQWTIISPSSIDNLDDSEFTNISIPEAPQEIINKLNSLIEDPNQHKNRSTYNIWAPSPTGRPNKIENMRICVSYAINPINRDNLFEFIESEFDLRRSSVESMMPFMRSAGLIQEIRKGIYTATPIARAWIKSQERINFIRILHAHMKFVGEILELAKNPITRSEIYNYGSKFGVNKEKIRWRINFLSDANLLIHMSYSSVKTSPLGRKLLEELPLADIFELNSAKLVLNSEKNIEQVLEADEYKDIAKHIIQFSTDPSAEGKQSGVAFEEIISKAFNLMGFESKRISGAGDTDVLVQWHSTDGQQNTAIIDAKSSSQGQISHTNVSDVAISAHKDKNLAEKVAIVAPGFTGETLRNTAAKKKWSLITADELANILIASKHLGLCTSDVAVVFESADGVSKIRELIETEQRKLDLIQLVVSRVKEESENDEPVSARDISLIERKSDIAPSADELVDTIATINSLQLDILKPAENMENPKHDTYQIGTVQSAINRLRALATSLENALNTEA